MDHDRLEQQLTFLKEIDKAKGVFRRTRLLDNSRYENDAEHAWHVAVMAMILAEHANAKELDLAKVVKMLLIHDIVEIDAGDTYLYDTAGQAQKAEKESRAAVRIFGLLPEDQRTACIALWEEFEDRETPEARFAAALDRLGPLIQNASTGGYAWRKHGISRQQAEAANERIAEGSDGIWQYAKALLAESEEKGFFPSDTDASTARGDATSEKRARNHGLHGSH